MAILGLSLGSRALLLYLWRRSSGLIVINEHYYPKQKEVIPI